MNFIAAILKKKCVFKCIFKSKFYNYNWSCPFYHFLERKRKKTKLVISTPLCGYTLERRVPYPERPETLRAGGALWKTGKSGNECLLGAQALSQPSFPHLTIITLAAGASPSRQENNRVLSGDFEQPNKEDLKLSTSEFC